MRMARSLKAEADYEARAARPRNQTIGVRLSDEEVRAAEGLKKPGEKTVASVLRRLLKEASVRRSRR